MTRPTVSFLVCRRLSSDSYLDGQLPAWLVVRLRWAKPVLLVVSPGLRWSRLD